MESKKPSNPSVYPDPMRGAEQSFSNQTPWGLESGITLRDEFANSAMQGYLSNPNIEIAMYDDLAKESYLIADAMLKQRELNQ